MGYQNKSTDNNKQSTNRKGYNPPPPVPLLISVWKHKNWSGVGGQKEGRGRREQTAWSMPNNIIWMNRQTWPRCQATELSRTAKQLCADAQRATLTFDKWKVVMSAIQEMFQSLCSVAEQVLQPEQQKYIPVLLTILERTYCILEAYFCITQRANPSLLQIWKLLGGWTLEQSLHYKK